MKAKLIRTTLNEYLEITPEGMEGQFKYTFADIVEIIDRSAKDEFTPGEFRNFTEFISELDINYDEAFNLIKYIFTVHPHMQDDIVNGGPFKKILDEYIESVQNKQNPGLPDLGPRDN